MNIDPLATDFSELLMDAKLISRESKEIQRSGSGLISREQNRFAIKCGFEGSFDALFNPLVNPTPSGVLLGDKDLHDLVAHFPNGKLMVAEGLYVNFSGTLGGYLETRNKSRKIWVGCEYPRPTHASEFHFTYPLKPRCFFNGPHYPTDKYGQRLLEHTNQRHLFLDGTLMKIDIHKDSTSIRFKSLSPVEIDKAVFWTQMAMSYAFGTTARFEKCKIISDTDECDLYSADASTHSSHPQGPITNLESDNNDALSVMKLSHEHIFTNPTIYEDIFLHASGIASARSSFPEIYSSACCRALEFVVQKSTAKISEEKSDEIQNECLRVRKLLEQLELPHMKNRIYGFLSSATRKSTSTIINELEDSEVVPKGTLQVFKDIRNKIAHGHVFNDDEADLYHFQAELIRDAYYIITLKMMGYTGKTVMYSKPGWPLRTI